MIYNWIRFSDDIQLDSYTSGEEVYVSLRRSEEVWMYSNNRSSFLKTKITKVH